MSTSSIFFAESVAPAFIIGASIFAIFWGVVNALLVSISTFCRDRALQNFLVMKSKNDHRFNGHFLTNPSPACRSSKLI